MKNNQSEKGIVEKIQEVCTVREVNDLNCRGCKFKGQACSHAINYLKSKVTRPNQINIK